MAALWMAPFASCGMLQMIIGTARLGVLIRMVPHSVMLGFVNGLAIVICMAQFGSFKTVSPFGGLEHMQAPSLWIMVALVALTMAIIRLLPKLTKAIPASLVAILVVTGIGVAYNRMLPGDMAAQNQSHVVMNVGEMLATHAKVAPAKSVLSSDDSPSFQASDLTPAHTAESDGCTHWRHVDGRDWDL